MAEPLLSVRELSVSFETEQGRLVAVDGVSFDVAQGSTVALVGESGCGKSATAHAIMRLLPTPPARIDGGRVLFRGRDLLALSEREMRRCRGAQISIIFQDPNTALNPVYAVGAQLVEALRIHRPLTRRAARREAEELLGRVGFAGAAERFGSFPHELSGGMRQRVLIAIALCCAPALVIADEPTTALDMLTAAQVGALLAELKRERSLSLLLISHDLAMVGQHADRIVVLYAGQVVEQGASADLLADPAHPYTRALLGAVPPDRVRQKRRVRGGLRLAAIGGALPDMHCPPPGCRFAPRCAQAFDRCGEQAPELYQLPRPDHAAVRCLLYEGSGQIAAAVAGAEGGR